MAFFHSRFSKIFFRYLADPLALPGAALQTPFIYLLSTVQVKQREQDIHGTQQSMIDERTSP